MAPLQVYNSALVFSPEESIIKRAFSRVMPDWIETLPVVENTWPDSGHFLEGHVDIVTAIAFSPDGQLIASASYYFTDFTVRQHTIRLWDSATGVLRGTLKGHDNRIGAVVFSSTGQFLASGDCDTIRLWDPVTKSSRGTLRGHSSRINAMVFSPNAQRLASVHWDLTVCLWNVEKKTLIQQGKYSPSQNLFIRDEWSLSNIEILIRCGHPYGENLSFNHDGTRLEIDGKLLQIWSSDNSLHELEEINASYDVDWKQEWVTYKGRRVLWLPVNRRPGVYKLQNNTLVLGSESGRLIFFRFSKAKAPFQISLPAPLVRKRQLSSPSGTIDISQKHRRSSSMRDHRPVTGSRAHTTAQDSDP